MVSLADALTEQTALDLLLQTGTVVTDHADGTVTIDIAGSELRLPTLASYDPTVGDAAVVVNAGGRRLVIGHPGLYTGGGATGPAGRGITSAVVDGAGHLILTYTDATTVDTGYVVGPQGIQGNTGPAGPTGQVIVAYRARTTSFTTTVGASSATALGVIRLTGSVVAGRLYRVSMPSLSIYGTAAAAGRAQAELRYTTDGSNPTVSSTMLTQGGTDYNAAGQANQLPLSRLYVPGTNHTLTVTLFLWRISGGNPGVLAVATTPAEISIEDLGVTVAQTGADL